MTGNVTLLMPVYNGEAYLARAVTDALAAMGPRDRLVVQDGASSDNSLEILTRYANTDSRISVVSEPDSGQSDALNRALARAQTEWIGWLNCDDTLSEAGLSALLRAPADCDISLGGHAVLDSSAHTIREYAGERLDFQQLMNRGCYVFSGSLLVKRDLLQTVGGFPQSRHFAMDLDLMFRLCNQPDLRQNVVPNVVGSLRWHSDSKSGSSGHRFVIDAWRVRLDHRRGPSDVARAVRAAVIQSTALVATPIRHSKLYRRIRNASLRKRP